MARNASGVYSLPSGSMATTGQTILATTHNTPLTDLETDANTARPVVAGGTGATSASDARSNLGLALGSDVQEWDQALDDIAALAVTDGNIIVGDGTSWVAESGATARTSLGVPGLADANVWTANQTIRSSDAGAIVGPTFALDRNSASPAADDLLGFLQFSGRDSDGNSVNYTTLTGVIVDPTDASEDGQLKIATTRAGTAAYRVLIGAGLCTAGATGGDKGDDTINASEYYKDGAALVTKYDSGSITGWAVDSFEEVSHGLGDVPDVVTWAFRCVTTEGGYAADDEITLDRHSGLGTESSITVMANATSLRLSLQAAPARITTKAGGASFTLTPSKWAIVLRAVKFG